jgi:2-keto-4-pentenoate hydratase/2-oxohepta-3-ene-1,7-dioic acid hydratase in catechol pathway
MQFDFPVLISHAVQTWVLMAGTIIGSGTISYEDELRGACCLVEKRVLEFLTHGASRTVTCDTGTGSGSSCSITRGKRRSARLNRR